MKQYMPKSVVLAEIERLIKKNELYLNDNVSDEVRYQKTSAYSVLCDLRHFLNTIKVEEVDLEKEIDLAMPSKYCWSGDGEAVYSKEQMRNFAKHFFELGLNASNPLTWKDMMIIHKCIKDAMNYHLYKMMEGMEGQKVVYEEVLKRFKAQKGE